MSEDPEERRVLESIMERRKTEVELLAEFGAQIYGIDPGVTAYFPDKPCGRILGLGQGAFGEPLSFSRVEWKWLRPLLEELSAFRAKAKAKAAHGRQS